MDVRGRRTESYAFLVRSGAVGSMKREVLLEAERDLVYLTAVHHEFTEAGSASRADAVANTVQLIEELIASGHCLLATWGTEPSKPNILHEDTEGIRRLVVRGVEDRIHVWDTFLWSTPRGDAWVRQYLDVVEDLERGLATGLGQAGEGTDPGAPGSLQGDGTAAWRRGAPPAGLET